MIHLRFFSKAAGVGALAWLLAGTTSHAQLVPDGASATLANVTTNITGSLIVGTNGAFTLLVLSNNCLVTNAGASTIGLNASATSNEVRLVSPTARWLTGSSLVVADSGSANRLVVSGGALVANRFDAYVGVGAASSNNVALITGTNSLWNVGGSVNVGSPGSGNQLIVSNAARVVSGFQGHIGGVGTQVRVIGAGSQWNMLRDLYAGLGGTGSQLRIEDGGQVTSDNGNMGANTLDEANEVLVTGPGALWTNRLNLWVGLNGALNRLVISNGGWVVNGNGSVGAPGSTGDGRGQSNLVMVTGTGSVWSNRANLIVGLNSRANQMLVAHGAAVFTGGLGVLGVPTHAADNAATVADAGSRWLLSSDLYIGSNAPGNRLTVENGGFVDNAAGRIGYGPSSSNNVVLITGPGSIWNNRGDLDFGLSGAAGNQANVANGGRMASRAGTLNAQSAVLVTGNGSTWSNSMSVSVGSATPGNRLVIEAGGVVHSSGGTVGNFGSASNNAAVVTGSGSLWTNSSSLTIGSQVGFNRLIVSNGAAVRSSSGVMGSLAAAVSNQVVVTGPGSIWSNRTTLVLGGGSARNRADVSNGGWLADNDGYVGSGFGGNTNTVTLVGVGSGWNNLGNLFVGDGGSRNLLLASNGATVLSSNAFIGANNSLGHSNLALLTGTGTRWSNRFDLTIGNHSTGNRLEVKDGAQVFAGGDAFVNRNATAISNSVLVSGPGASWTVFSNLFLTSVSKEIPLIVTNGGRTASGVGFLSGQNTEVLVTGAGSTWSNLTSLIVGENGSGNTLIASSGATVASSNLIVGLNSVSTNNRVTVNGGTLRAASPAGTGVLDVRRGTNVLNAGLVDVDKLVLTNRGTIPVLTGFGNGSSNRFGNIAPATNGLSIITVAGYAGIVTKVSVTLSNLTTGFPASYYDILLVSPAGQKVMLMSDAGGAQGFANARLDFDDTAATELPNSMITSGTYRPTDVEPGETLPSPAPAGPYATTLSSFNGSDPNGVWSLYLVSDSDGGGSCCASLVGWSVQITSDQGPFFDSGEFDFNGGTLITRGAIIDNGLPFVVGGPGGVPAVWEVPPGAGINFAADGVIVGSLPAASTHNLLRLTGGTLQTPQLDVRGGTNRVEAGLADVTRLIVTSAAGQVEILGGTFRTPDTTVANGRAFTVGNGPGTGTFQMLGGTHRFADSLVVANNGSLIGNGLVDGILSVAAGGRIAPGPGIHRIDITDTAVLQGTAQMQIDKTGLSLTNDHVVVGSALIYGGTLTVTETGSDPLAAGDRFQLFDATAFVNSFATLNLPPLAPGLAWRNNLSVDGSIEVITGGGQPGIASIIRSGTNVILAGTNGTPGANYTVLAATNVALPLSNWTSIATRQFDASGGFSFTNAIVPGIRQRFFLLRVP